MTSEPEREKIASRLPEDLRRALKIGAAARHRDLQDVLVEALEEWRQAPWPAELDTAGADSFGTWLPPHVWQSFRDECHERNISITQGLAQAVHVWLRQHSQQEDSVHVPRRKIVANQKGGVGKTAVSSGLSQALAEEPGYTSGSGRRGLGRRVLVVDFDPQGHLSKQLGIPPLPMDGDTLLKHMIGEARGDIRDLLVGVDDARFGGRLYVLPASADAFVLDVRLSTIRAREGARERALEPLEAEFDEILIDCPPSLGLTMDCAIYYGRERDEADEGRSGVLIPVEAEDSSADAFALLTGQIEDLRGDMRVSIGYLGLVVNKYDSRRGYIATSSLEQWQALGDPAVVGVLGDRKEQREAVRVKQGLLSYAPECAQSEMMREIAERMA